MTQPLRTCKRSKWLCITVSRRLKDRTGPFLAQVIRLAILAQHKEQRPIDIESIGLVRTGLVRFSLRVAPLTSRQVRRDASALGLCLSDYVEACCWLWFSSGGSSFGATSPGKKHFSSGTRMIEST